MLIRRSLRKSQAAFAGLDQWFDRLPQERQDEIWQLHDAVASRLGDPRVLPPSHGNDQVSQLGVGVARFREATDPFALIRLGDADLSLLGAGFAPRSSPNRFEWYRLAAGFGREALAVRGRFIEAVRGAEIVGLHQNWEAVATSTRVMLTMLGIPMPLSTGVEVHLPYRLLTDGSLFGRLAGKRVVLVGWLAPRLREVWGTAEFRDSYAAFGPVDEIEIVGAVETTSREDGGAAGDYESALAELRRHEYDVALLGCGVVAKPLAWQVRNDGRTGLDVGFVFDALLGNPEREVRPLLRDVSWPDANWMRSI
jgi:hypothetical protein